MSISLTKNEILIYLVAYIASYPYKRRKAIIEDSIRLLLLQKSFNFSEADRETLEIIPKKIFNRKPKISNGQARIGCATYISQKYFKYENTKTPPDFDTLVNFLNDHKEIVGSIIELEEIDINFITEDGRITLNPIPNYEKLSCIFACIALDPKRALIGSLFRYIFDIRSNN